MLVLLDGTHMMVPVSWTQVGETAPHLPPGLGLFRVEDLLEMVHVLQKWKELRASKK